MRQLHANFRKLEGPVLFISCIALLCCSVLRAQQTGDGQAVDKATLQLLLTRIDQLESRVRQLEAERQRSGSENTAPAAASMNLPATEAAMSTLAVPVRQSSNVSGAAPTTPPESDQTQSENVMAERMDLSKTLLRIRGFGDISLHGDTQKGDTTSFSLGQLDLFVSSDVSDKFKFLSEIVFEAGANNFYGVTSGSDNTFGVDIERYLLQYSHNDYFNISAGRGHTAIGYYNTAYHHSTWLQTTTGRPFLFDFEDHGGILPIHTVGVSASGLVPSGRWGLHYVAEVGNGRASRTPLVEEPVQNEVDDQNRKAFNLAVFARPESIPGLQAGISIYRNVLAPLSAPRIGETILAAHAVLIRSKYEWLSEALIDRHAVIRTPRVFGSAQESVRRRDFRGFCLRGRIGYSPSDARQRLDAGIGMAGLQGLPA